MRFLAPHWFLLLPLLLVLAWFWPGLRLRRPLRGGCLLLLVLLLVEPQLRMAGDGLDLWVLVDRSDSARDVLLPRLAEWESILEKSRGSADTLRYVDYAEEAVTRGALLTAGPAATTFSGATGATRTASALRYTLAQMPEDRAARVLVLGDGFSTEPLDGLAERLQRQGVPLDYRLAGASVVGDVRVTGLHLPRRVQPREAFMIEVTAQADYDGAVPVELLRDGRSLGRRELMLKVGVGRLRLTDRVAEPGAHAYELRLLPDKDPLPGNNVAKQWLQVEGGPRLVLISAYTNDPMADVLQKQGFTVEVITEPRSAGVGALTGAKAVVLNNVPAYLLQADFLQALRFYVTVQGGGLAMIGGKHSFAAGGYYGSPVESLLPVSMELKQEHRKLAVAVAIVMDRSGSMGMTAANGRTKMELANEGAARSIELLGESDQVTLIAVDSAPHVVAPITAVGANRDKLTEIARRIQVAGGGIFVYTGLKEAWKELQTTTVGQRHVILFADAADAEEPGDYQKLLAEMTAQKTTVSVIGMGADTDSDAAFLKDVARRGQGRIFFDDADELPAIFAQETVAVARSAFLTDPVELTSTAGWSELAATPLQWLAKVDGYNLSYLRPGATQAVVTKDEYAAPLLAFWQRGSGRVATVSFPMGGEHSAAVRAWPQYGDLVQSLGRWLMGEAVPAGLGLRVDVDGSQLLADLFYDESWTQRIAQAAPQLLITQGVKDEPTAVPWERLAPGHYQARVDVVGDAWLRGAVRVGNTAFPFGPLNVATSPEWAFDAGRVAELQALATRSGGGERVDLSDVWQAPRPETWRSLTVWWLVALLLLLMVEAWHTRVFA